VFSEQRLAGRRTIRHAKRAAILKLRPLTGMIKAGQVRREKCCGTARFYAPDSATGSRRFKIGNCGGV